MALRVAKGRNREFSEPEPSVGQKQAVLHRFRLEVDRQTKSSYETYEAAEEVGAALKKEYPKVQVAVYDSVDGVKKIIEPTQA